MVKMHNKNEKALCELTKLTNSVQIVLALFVRIQYDKPIKWKRFRKQYQKRFQTMTKSLFYH